MAFIPIPIAAAQVLAERGLRSGARPGETPIEQPSKFDLVINSRTAKALGLVLSPPLLLRADLIE